MTARAIEQALIARCVTAARDPREAKVFRLAAGLIRGRFPAEALSLTRASDDYFARHPEDQLPAEAVVRNRWVIGLPRLRDRLTRALNAFEPQGEGIDGSP